MSQITQLLRRVWQELPHAPKVAYRQIAGAPGLFLPTQRINISGCWYYVAKDPDGQVLWTDFSHNIVVNEGLNHMLDVTLHNQTATTTWYIGYHNGTETYAATDTLASNAWDEWTNYTPGTRPEWTEGAASSQSITNGTAVTITSSGDSQSVKGAFLAASATKSETASILFNVDQFSGGNKTLNTSETLDTTVTISASSS